MTTSSIYSAAMNMYSLYGLAWRGRLCSRSSQREDEVEHGVVLLSANLGRVQNLQPTTEKQSCFSQQVYALVSTHHRGRGRKRHLLHKLQVWDHWSKSRKLVDRQCIQQHKNHQLPLPWSQWRQCLDQWHCLKQVSLVAMKQLPLDYPKASCQQKHVAQGVRTK